MPEIGTVLRTSLHEAADRFAPGPGFADVVDDHSAALRSRNRRRVAAGTIAAGFAVAAVSVAVVGLGAGRDPERHVTVDATGPATSAPRATPPPSGYEDSGYTLWLSASVVPSGGADVAAVLVNRGGPEAMFGVAADLDRWDVDRWVPHRWVGLCLDHWFCTAQLEDPAGDHAVRSIGLSATPGSPGAVERFRAEGLDPGWYRLRQEANEGFVAAGVFEVSENAPQPAPLDDTSAPSSSVSPILVPSTGAEVRLTPLMPPVVGMSSAEDLDEAIAGLSETAAVERWEGRAWVPVTTVVLSAVSEPPGSADRVAQIPSLLPGDYRLVRDAPGGESHPGRFFVVQPDELAADDSSGATGNDADVGPELTPGTGWALPEEGVAVEVDGRIVFVGLDGTVRGHIIGNLFDPSWNGALAIDSDSTDLVPVEAPLVGQLWLDPSDGAEQSVTVMGTPLWNGFRVLYSPDDAAMLLLDGTDATGVTAEWPEDAPWWVSSDHRVVTYATCAEPGCPHRFYDSDMGGGGELPGDCWIAATLGDFAQTRICDGGRTVAVVGPGSGDLRSMPVPQGTGAAVAVFGDLVRLGTSACGDSGALMIADGSLSPVALPDALDGSAVTPLGVASDGRVVLHADGARCGAIDIESGVYLADLETGDLQLVWAGSSPAQGMRMWRSRDLELLGGVPRSP